MNFAQHSIKIFTLYVYLLIARLTNPSPLYFQQFRDSSSVIKEGLQGYSDLEIKELVEEISKSFKNVSLRGV